MNLNKVLKELDKLHRDNKIINFRISNIETSIAEMKRCNINSEINDALKMLDIKNEELFKLKSVLDRMGILEVVETETKELEL